MNDIGWTDAEIRESREKSNEIKNAYERGYDQARKEFERPEGKWIITGETDEFYGLVYKCTHCGEAVLACGCHNFCTWCGADMRGDK